MFMQLRLLLFLSLLPSIFFIEAKSFGVLSDNCNANKYTPAELFKSKVNSVVVITSEGSQGSGFVVERRKGHSYILTNAHVVGNKKRVDVKWNDGEVDRAEVVGNLGGDKLERDLALIKVAGTKGTPIKLSKNSPEVGSDVVVIGAPSGLEFSLTRGVVSQIRDRENFVQIDAPVNPGNSGGPVFNNGGCAIGVVTFKSGEGTEGLNFAIGNKQITKFLKNPIIDEEAINKQTLANLPLPPKSIEGPFPPFEFEYGETYSQIQVNKGNKEWTTLTVTTELSPNREPKTNRLMIENKSIRKDEDWFSVKAIRNALSTFAEVTVQKTGQKVYLSGSYPFERKINCKDQIVQHGPTTYKGRTTGPTNYYKVGPGWFMTKYEIKKGKLVDLPGNSKEVDQMENAALFNYFCKG
ncbi:HtrA protease/chaperone protein [Prochlorococcus sp. MIT 0801]|nr:HtrA protease/chaperone protein [Prochlorococcus sp. MIT 0801]